MCPGSRRRKKLPDGMTKNSPGHSAGRGKFRKVMSMRRTRGFLWCAVLVLPVLSQPGAHADDLVRKIQGSSSTDAARSAAMARGSEPRSHYADGTGNMLVDRLNESQLDQNYKGPVYYPGQPIPPFRAIDIDRLTFSDSDTVRDTASSRAM